MIHQLKSGDACQGAVAMIESLQSMVTKAGKPYIRLSMRDESGDIPAVIWDSTDLPQDIQQYLAPGRVISVDGSVSEYNGKLQVTISGVRPSRKTPLSLQRKQA